MTRSKNIVWTGIARALAMLPHAAGDGLRDGRQELKSDLNTQDQREYRQDHRSGAGNEELSWDKAEIRESLDNLRDSRRGA
jgi:hypothetical protein